MVDDGIVIINNTSDETKLCSFVLKELYPVNKYIQFTVELEKDVNLPFLDDRFDSSLKIKWNIKAIAYIQH